MRKHATFKEIHKSWERGLFRAIIFVILCVAVILISILVLPKLPFHELHGLSPQEALRKLITDMSFISVCLTALASATVVFFVDVFRNRSEEYTKLNDEKRAIIHRYKSHFSEDDCTAEIIQNRYDSVGHDLQITAHIADRRPRRYLYPYIYDKYSDERINYCMDVGQFTQKHVLTLPNVNVYANVEGNATITIHDSPEQYQLPDFLINCATNLISAHKHSIVRNATSIRLRDVSFRQTDETDELTLETQKSTYYQMLLTNRCMDYCIEQGVTVRDLYEYNPRLNDLKDSLLCNQIGINGLVITSDGYLLIEKRSRKKTTWKNKFAQPISLAFKPDKFGSCYDRQAKVIIEGVENELFATVIAKTLKENFGITKDQYAFDLRTNFLGLARDLVEGGKPNLYFYVVLNIGAEALKRQIEDFSADVSGNPLKKEKLDSKYFLVRHDKLAVDFKYGFTLRKRDDTLRVYRKLSPRVRFGAQNCLQKSHKYCPIRYYRESGDALLACIAYMELAHERIFDANGQPRFDEVTR